MTDLVSVFLEDPTLGLPVTLLLGATAGWLIARVSDRPASTRRPTPRPVADRDPVSRTYHAFESGAFSDVLVRALGRLDRLSEKRFGRAVARLPWSPWGRRRLPLVDRDAARTLRRLRARLDRQLATTVRREAGIWLRLDFWRSRPELRRRFRARIAPLLEDVSALTLPAGAA